MSSYVILKRMVFGTGKSSILYSSKIIIRFVTGILNKRGFLNLVGVIRTFILNE